ncbi:hypothetical protein [Streptomyces phytophilus]|uniref:hypothetical protein n=1 Tax=Streptomyces phytophilus TaxID=722715 RepID=UPI0015F0B617|nr:hypothetical protein [Streptomyces phytophilus]
MATDVDLYSRVVQHESLGGATADSTPDEWARALPGDFLEDKRKKFMRRDYGLVEVFFERVDAGGVRRFPQQSPLTVMPAGA